MGFSLDMPDEAAIKEQRQSLLHFRREKRLLQKLLVRMQMLSLQ